MTRREIRGRNILTGTTKYILEYIRYETYGYEMALILFSVTLNVYFITRFSFPFLFSSPIAQCPQLFRVCCPAIDVIVCVCVCVCVCVWFIPNPTLPMAPSVLAGQRTCVMSDKLNHETVNNWNQSVIRFHESPSLPIAIHMYVMMRHDSQSSLQIFSCMCKWFIKHSVTSWIQFIKFTKKKFFSHFIRGCYGCYPCWRNVLVTAVVRFIADWL